MFQAHAFDTNGISNKFLDEGRSIMVLKLRGNRFERAAVEWQPPDSGTYFDLRRSSQQSGDGSGTGFRSHNDYWSGMKSDAVDHPTTFTRNFS